MLLFSFKEESSRYGEQTVDFIISISVFDSESIRRVVVFGVVKMCR